MTAPASGPGTGKAFEALPSPLEAVDDLRSAAKWTLAAEGAVGAALISGGPLVAVGQVHGTGHALLAGAGLAVALGGVGLAIWFTSKVLSPRLTTPATLRSPALAGLRQVIEAEPAQFLGVMATKVDACWSTRKSPSTWHGRPRRRKTPRGARRSSATCAGRRRTRRGRPRMSDGCWPWPTSGRSRPTCGDPAGSRWLAACSSSRGRSCSSSPRPGRRMSRCSHRRSRACHQPPPRRQPSRASRPLQRRRPN
jgi:hypothetical protein